MPTMMIRRGWPLVLLLTACSSSPPTGEPGAPADALAEKMQAAVEGAAWAETGAVQWVFAGRHRHLWDRRRHLARVEWDDATMAVVDIDARVGVAFEGEKRLIGDAAKDALDAAHAKWTNDAFWLNPVMKAFDPGTERQKIAANDEGEVGLLVQYRSGGRTPGDAYLWRLGPENRPTRWQMWTSNIPVGGVEASWENWTQLETGAWVSTKHELPVFTLELTEVAGAATLEALRDDAPFAALDACKKADDCDPF